MHIKIYYIIYILLFDKFELDTDIINKIDIIFKFSEVV